MTRRRRVDVNLEELDQIIDRSQRAPLSESEGEKLKTALHAMAERLQQKRSTEKTSAVLPQDKAPAGKPDTSESAPAGHGRNPASAFRGANKVVVTHPTLHSGDTCPECRRGRLYHQKEPATLVRFVGHAPLEATDWKDCKANWECLCPQPHSGDSWRLRRNHSGWRWRS